MALDFTKLKPVLKQYFKEYEENKHEKAFQLSYSDLELFDKKYLEYTLIKPYIEMIFNEYNISKLNSNISNVRKTFSEKNGKRSKSKRSSKNISEKEIEKANVQLCNTRITKENRLGSGMYGDVYKVDDKTAVKVQMINLEDKLIESSRKGKKLHKIVSNEITSSKKMGKNGLGPEIYDHAVCQLGENVYALLIYMELIVGITLNDWFDKEHTPEELDQMKEQILEAIDKMHKMKIIHNDIHYNNMLVTDEGKLKIIDMGLATDFDEDFNYEEEKEKIIVNFEFNANKNKKKRDKSNHRILFKRRINLYICICADT